MATISTRAELIDRLAYASLTGTLGLFIGSGFSKALTRGGAPSWAELLQRVARALSLPDPLLFPTEIIGKSFPRIASDMVSELASRFSVVSPSEHSTLHNRSLTLLKTEVSRQATLVADPAMLAAFRSVLQPLDIDWIVTTNYDYLSEHCCAHPVTLLPDQLIRARRGTVPVFHIHGHNLVPDSLVLTEQDYIDALDHSTYRHVRLGVLFAESTTLMLGYALGDTNIQTALRYARAYGSRSDEFRAADLGSVVFLNRTSSPSSEPRLGNHGELVVDSTEILLFLQEVLIARQAMEVMWTQVKAAVETFVATPASGIGFVLDKTWRRSFIAAVQKIPAISTTDSIVAFVRHVIDTVALQAKQFDGWSHYKTWLDVVLDMLEQWPVGTLPADLFECVAGELCKVSPYIDPSASSVRTIGFAWDATALWHARKRDIFATKPELLKALIAYAERVHNNHASVLLRLSP